MRLVLKDSRKFVNSRIRMVMTVIETVLWLPWSESYTSDGKVESGGVTEKFVSCVMSLVE